MKSTAYFWFPLFGHNLANEIFVANCTIIVFFKAIVQSCEVLLPNVGLRAMRADDIAGVNNNLRPQ